MADSSEIPKPGGGIDRRAALKWIGKLGLGAAAAAIPSLANAQDARTYMEAGREISITSEAERTMKEWGIELKGSEITAPAFREPELRGKSFPGICLTSNAQKVLIGLWPRPLYVSIMVFNSDNTVEFISFHHDRTYSVESQAKGYVEGRCEKEIS